MNIHDFKADFLKLIASNDPVEGKKSTPLYSAGNDETSYQGNQSGSVITFDKN